MREQLFINGYEIPLSRSLDPSFTRSIIDIKEPEKRSATYSKSITVPNSKEAAKVFGMIFDINTVDGTFNPLVKADVVYLVDSIQIIVGYCQLNELIKTNNLDIEYSITIYSNFANFFKTIQGLYLSDVQGLDIYNHPLTNDIQQFSSGVDEDGIYQIIEDGDLVDAELGKGYIYALVDFGFSTDNVNWKVQHIGCSVFAQEYWDRIFADAGFTYEFTDTDFANHFKHLIIPSSPEQYKLDLTEIESRQFRADTPESSGTGSETTGNVSKVAFTADETIIFSNEIFDGGTNYNPATGIYTVAESGYYDINGYIDLTGRFKPTDTVSNLQSVGYIDVKIKVLFYDASEIVTYTTEEVEMRMGTGVYAVGNRSTDSAPTYPSDQYLTHYPFPLGDTPRFEEPPNRMKWSISGLLLAPSDTIKIVWSAKYSTDYPDYFRTITGTYSGGQADITFEEGVFFNKVANLLPIEGNIFDMYKAVPKVLQTDFILNYFKEYNLYADIDPNNEKNLLIAPRDSFYTSNIVNLDGKVSIDKGIKYKPMGALDVKSYLFKHKEDKDYLNDKYTKSYDEVYGQQEIIVNNEFTTNDFITKLTSSPTPLADNGTGTSSLVIPTIVKIDDLGQKVSTNFNWRTLYYAGLKPCTPPWKHISVLFPAGETFTEYPYAGHFDDPYNPTLDINFGLPREVYYEDAIAPITVTDNNLYNKYHSKFIREITDRDSKIVEAYIHMTPLDFNQWSFRDLYYFENAYFRLNKIEGFNPTSTNLTKCEFLKLKEVSPYKGTVLVANGQGGTFEPATQDGSITTQVTQAQYNPYLRVSRNTKEDGNLYNANSQQVQGSNNVISKSATNVIVNGDENRVFSGANNINLLSSNNCIVSPNLQNVTLINCEGLTVTESNSTYINGQLVESQQPTTIKEITSSEYLDTTVKGYLVDTTSSNVNIDLDGLTYSYTVGQIWYFRKKVSANQYRIRAITGTTINGTTSETVSTIGLGTILVCVSSNEFITIKP